MRYAVRTAAAVSAVAMTLGGCSGGSPAPAALSPASDRPLAGAGEFVLRTFASDAGTLDYRLYIPTALPGSEGLPLLVMLHGCTQDAADFAAGSRMNEVAEERGFLVLYPEQPASANPQRCWNWFLAAHQARDRGEPAILAGLVREVAVALPVDRRRIYVAGVSAGGAMATVMAAAYPDLVAAFASHSGIRYAAATDVGGALAAMRGDGVDAPGLAEPLRRAMGWNARAVPGIFFHGAEDPVVAVANAQGILAQWAELARDLEVLPASSAPDVEAVVAGGGRATRSVLRDSAGDALLEGWIVDELGHAWSGGSPDGTYTDPRGPDASREIARFLLTHRLP